MIQNKSKQKQKHNKITTQEIRKIPNQKNPRRRKNKKTKGKQKTKKTKNKKECCEQITMKFYSS